MQQLPAAQQVQEKTDTPVSSTPAVTFEPTEEVDMGGVLALIPARGGSQRVPGKNIRALAGNPLIAYTITAAKQSGQFQHVLVSSDDVQTLEIASYYGADVIRRPAQLASSTSPDIAWIKHALEALPAGIDCETFSILRPTSPFRTAGTIRRAFELWGLQQPAAYTSLRAIEPVSQHPGKMWRLHANEMVPLLPQPTSQPWHDSQHITLPPVYVQNASLEISRVQTVEKTGTISGQRVLPFLTQGNEGFDINSEIDWLVAELLVERGQVTLPEIAA